VSDLTYAASVGGPGGATSGHRYGTSGQAALRRAGSALLTVVVAPEPVGTTIGRICSTKLPDTALHSRHRCAAAGGNDDFADDAKEAGSIALGTVPRATIREFLGTAARDAGVSRAAVPLFIQAAASACVDAKLYPAVFRVIRPIVVPTGYGASIRTRRSATIAVLGFPVSRFWCLITHHD